MSDAAQSNEPNDPPESQPADASAENTPRKPRRRGSRGGRNRNRNRNAAGASPADAAKAALPEELPERMSTNRPPADVAERALVRKPQIGDTMPAPTPSPPADGDQQPAKRRRRRGGRGRGRGNRPVEAAIGDAIELDAETLERRRGRERKGRPVGRYLMCVHVQAGATQIAVLEGRSLIEHYVSRPQDDAAQIHGNIYLGRVQNVLPGMEAAFVDIGTPKNAVLYRGDVQFDPEDVESSEGAARIEQILKPRQSIICQVTKNPIGAKGARLTQEVSLPGRFVVLIPNSATYGISKRLADDERKRLRNILDKIKPAQHGLIVRTAAEGATREELERDVALLIGQWEQIDSLAKRSQAPTLLYREPDMAVRVIREEFNSSYRGVVIDDRHLYDEVQNYVSSITPELADRVELHDHAEEPLPLFEAFHVHEQLHKALDRKVWLPSGGSLIIERTEALTVIDVNTGKNVGTSSLEETVFRNNLEAAEEVARQLRLRDIGGIIVIDFIDMEIKKNRDEVVRVFRDALARDKTRTQVFDISELGLVEMTRKRIGEGLIESFSSTCPVCEGRGIVLDQDLLS
jgi:ribonuclease E